MTSIQVPAFSIASCRRYFSWSSLVPKEQELCFLLAPPTFVRRSLSDTDLSGIRRPSAYVNFFKSLLLLHFLLDSFQTRYTYFLGQSPNFVLIRILKFGFSEFFFINFHQNSWKLLLLLHFSMDSFETRYTYFLGQSLNFVLFRILKFGFSDLFFEFSSNFHWNRYCSYNFQWIPLKLCTLII